MLRMGCQKPESDLKNREPKGENKYPDTYRLDGGAHDIAEPVVSPLASNLSDARFMGNMNRCVVVVGQMLVSPGNYFALTFWTELS